MIQLGIRSWSRTKNSDYDS